MRTDLMDRVITDSSVDWERLQGSSILITGGTGLVGSIITRSLLYANEKLGLDTKITIVTRRASKVAELFGNSNAVTAVEADIREISAIEGHFDHIIHCAAVTSSRTMVEQPVETIDLAYNGTLEVLKLAARSGVKGMVYVSSMEIYGMCDASMNPVTEDKLGAVDLRNVRSSYQEGKRICELLCNCYSHEYKVPVVSARLAQTFGYGVSKDEGRVFAQFAKSALNGEDIVLHTKGMSVGNYVDTLDMASAILCLLTRGEPGRAYNVANEANSCHIYEMAQLCADRIGGGRIKVVYDIPESNVHGYAPDTEMRLDASLLRSLGWNPRFSLEDMYRNMIDYWKES